jgi:hypothetical protein
MATAIPDSTNLISIEETDFSSSVSEAVFQKLGGGVNYAINLATGFDSRIDTLETKTSFLPTAWVYNTSPTLYGINGGGDVSSQFSTKILSYIIEGNKLFWSIFLVPSGYTSARVAVQLPTLTVDTAKLPIQAGSNRFISGSQQQASELGVFDGTIGDFTYPMGVVPLYEGAYNRIQVLRNTTASGFMPLVP